MLVFKKNKFQALEEDHDSAYSVKNQVTMESHLKKKTMILPIMSTTKKLQLKVT